MNEQGAKVEDIKVRENHTPAADFWGLHRSFLNQTRGRVERPLNDKSRNTRRRTKRPRHQPIAKVVDMPGNPPPTRDQQLGASLGGDVLEMLDARVVRVSAEAVLLGVRAAEDVVADSVDGQSEDDAADAHLRRKDGQVSRLEGVEEWNPDKIAKGQHVAESVHNDVDHSQNGRFRIEAFQDVESLECSDQDDGIGHVAVGTVLMSDIGQVQDDPSDQAGPHFAKDLDIDRPRDVADKRDGELDPRVEFTTNEEVVQDIASVAAGGQFTVVGIGLARLGNGEAVGVDKD